MRADYFQERPEQLKVSLTNVCNFRCRMCYNPGLHQPRGFIGDELMYRILDECAAEGIDKVSLGGTGEPLLHPRFLDFLSYAKHRGLWTSSTTNCTRLTPAVAAGLISLGMDRLNISVYSANAQEHRDYTGTDLFETVRANIGQFLRLWQASGRKMRLNMWFLEIPGVNDYDRYLAAWGPLAEEVGLVIGRKTAQNWGGRVPLGPGRRFRIGWARGPVVNWRRRVRCGHVRNYLHVLHDGTVLPCCNIAESCGHAEVEFGNLQRQGILETWRSARYLAFKEAQFRLTADFPFCRDCSEVHQDRSLTFSIPAAIRLARSAFARRHPA